MNAVVSAKAEKQVAAPMNDAQTVMGVIDRAARDPNVDIDKLERLLQMHERILENGAKAGYAAALADLQPDLPTIQERGTIKNKAGGVQSRYALWEDVVAAITPALSRHGFALSFRTAVTDKLVTVTAVLSHRQGHSVETSLPLPIDISDYRNMVQSIGSSVSYGKRYTAMALLNLRSSMSDDDDGQAAGGEKLVSEEQIANIEALLSEVGADKKRFLNYICADSLETILAKNYEAVIRSIEAKRRGAR